MSKTTYGTGYVPRPLSEEGKAFESMLESAPRAFEPEEEPSVAGPLFAVLAGSIAAAFVAIGAVVVMGVLV